jgi:hypothetical protein
MLEHFSGADASTNGGKSKMHTHRLVCVLLVGFTAPLFGDDGEGIAAREAISTCTTINHSGYYRVVNNITTTAGNVQTDLFGFLGCIVITTSNVTLDLGGHTLFGPPGSRINGTGVSGIDGVGNGLSLNSVSNGVVTGFFDGVILYGNGHVVQNIRAMNNLSSGIVAGFVLGGQGGHRIVGNTIIANFWRNPAAGMVRTTASQSLHSNNPRRREQFVAYKSGHRARGSCPSPRGIFAAR